MFPRPQLFRPTFYINIPKTMTVLWELKLDLPQIVSKFSRTRPYFLACYTYDYSDWLVLANISPRYEQYLVIWLYLVKSCYIWGYLVTYVYILVYIGLSCYILLYLVISYYILLYLVISGFIRINLIMSGYIWVHLIKSGYIWSHLVIYGYI